MDPNTFGNTTSAKHLTILLEKFSGRKRQAAIMAASNMFSTFNFRIKQISKIEDRRTRAYLLGLLRKDYMKKTEHQWSFGEYLELQTAMKLVLATTWRDKAIKLGINTGDICST